MTLVRGLTIESGSPDVHTVSQEVQANLLDRPSVWQPQLGHCSVVK
jgi:hypothetical protein